MDTQFCDEAFAFQQEIRQFFAGESVNQDLGEP